MVESLPELAIMPEFTIIPCSTISRTYIVYTATETEVSFF